MFEARYSFLQGKDGSDVPFAVYVEDEHGRVIFSSGIHVDKASCDIPETLEDFCMSSPSHEEVMGGVERAMRSLIPA